LFLGGDQAGLVGVVANREGVVEGTLADETAELTELEATHIIADCTSDGRTALRLAGKRDQVVENRFFDINGDSHRENKMSNDFICKKKVIKMMILIYQK